MAQLALALLGPFQVTLDGVPVAGFESQKVRALLTYLAIEADRPQGRDVLAGLLWPNLSDQDARTNLRQALSNLRQALGDQQASPPYVQVRGTTIQFNRISHHRLDVVVFTDLLTTCEQHPHRHPTTCTSCAQRLQRAVNLYQGEFLAGFFLADSAAFEEWALLKREWLHQHALAAFTQLASYHERRGEYALAARFTRHQLELDPWREESHRQLMRVLALNGQRSAALVQYATCRRILAAELAVAPEEATITLCAQIQRGEVVPAVRRRPPSNLAAHTPLTPLIGRETELADIADRLERRDCRLLTLVGPGGIGKTRLALAVAAEQSASFRDGVAFVLLAPVSAAELLVPAIANAVGVRFTGSAEPQAQLLASLRTKDMLLVLDNVEHLLAVAPLVSELLVACADLTVLVTSRAPLHLSAEQQFPVPSLALPSLSQLSDNIRLTQYAAVALFVARAQAVQPAFQLTATTAATVATICVRLDGLPLAIELAAARITLLTPDAILSRLSNALGLLTGGARDVPVRQQTLRNTIDWSYTLLSPKEQILFRRLAVFVDGWTLAAAEAIGCTEDEPIDVLGTLQTLVDHSLLHLEAGSASVPRFRMLETIRAYAREQLEATEGAAAIGQRHAVYYLMLAETAEPLVRSAAQGRWLNRREAEYSNIRAALYWFTAHQATTYGWADNLYMFTVPPRALEHAQATELVLKTYAPNAAGRAHAAREWHALNRLHAVNYPVPHGKLFEPDDHHFGSPFIVMEHVPGKPLWQVYETADQATQDRLTQVFVAQLVALHTLDPQLLALETTLAQPYEFIEHELEQLRRDSQHSPHRTLTEVVQWLEQRKQTVPCDRPAILHRDYHPWNVLIDTAEHAWVIDWDWQIGDARFDLAWTLMLMRRSGFDMFSTAVYAQYTRQSDRSLDALAYFEVVTTVRWLLNVTYAVESEAMPPAATADFRKFLVEPVHHAEAFLKERTGIAIAISL